jgi:Na+-transporting methylmalonyl-CoA/oxaloacetate decarboxylase gamma subunit
MKNKKFILNNIGSFTLSALISTVGGMAFVLLFLNLVRYIGAMNAVEQAVRTTSRCATTTDPSCVATLRETANVDLDWYGIETSLTKNVKVDTYNYQASMTRQYWEASLSTYQIQESTPLLTWVSGDVPVKTFERNLNLYFDDYGRIALPAGVEDITYKPKSEPNFPTEVMDINSAGGHFGNIRSDVETVEENLRNEGNTQDFVNVQSLQGWQPLVTGVHTYYTSPRISIPALNKNAKCLNRNGSECSSAIAAGESFKSGEWKDFAYVALTSLAHYEIDNGTDPDLRYGGFREQPGLVLRAYNPNGSLYTQYCLGGFTTVNVSEGSGWFNMYLVGPNGSIDGPSTWCPNNKMDGIKVPRGGSFEIQADLYPIDSRTGGRIGRAEMYFLYTFDDYVIDKYNIIPNQTVQCEAQFSYGNLNRPICENIVPTRDCPGLTPGNVIDAKLCYEEWPSRYKGGYRIVPRCTSGPHSYYISPNFKHKLPFYRPGDSIFSPATAVCEAGWIPANIPAPKDNRFCGNWEEEVSLTTKISVPILTKSCSLATNIKTETTTCGETAPVGSLTSADQCDAFSEIASLQNESLHTINATQISSAIVFPDVKASDFKLDYSERIWGTFSSLENYPMLVSSTLKDCSIGEANLINEPGCKSTTKVTSLSPLFIHKDGASFVVEHASEFFDLGTISGTENIEVNPLQATSEVVQINSVYPFNNLATPEIPYWGQEEQYADYDLDCTVEPKCSGNFTRHESLEEALRSYASLEIPEALDPNYNFSYTAQLVEKSAVVADLEGLPECTPIKSNCKLASNEVFIQTLPSQTSPQGPSECNDGTYSYCYSKAPLGADLGRTEVVATIDDATAQQIGLAELTRLLPDAKLDCVEANAAGCANINIETAGPMATVTANYNMSLIFPLDAILGKSTLTISHSKTEAREIMTAGN